MFQKYAKMPFYPGPVSLYPEVAQALGQDYGPPRMTTAFMDDYREVCSSLQHIMGTRQEVVLPTGEGMLGLWGALKCCLKPGDAMVSVGTGVFGDGFGDMASSLGCIVEKVSLPYDATLTPEALERVDDAIQRLNPVMITAIHCETPSGTLNPLHELGKLKKDRQVPLFVVDAVASIGGAPVAGDDWNVDILLGGSQKCLSCPADVSPLAISETAWDIMGRVNYQGYEAILPFRGGQDDVFRLPYTPHWAGVAALKASTRKLMAEGLPAVFARHDAVAARCRQGLASLNIDLWPVADAISSPTVTAAKVPLGFTWAEWRDELAAHGLIVGGSLGPMSGKVFRLGHMGAQADMATMEQALLTMEQVLASR